MCLYKPPLPLCLYVHKSGKGGKLPRVLYQHTSYQTLAYARLPSQAHILSSTFSNSSATKPLKLIKSQSTLPPHRTARSLQNYLHMRLGELEPYIKFMGCWHSHTFLGCLWQSAFDTWHGLLLVGGPPSTSDRDPCSKASLRDGGPGALPPVVWDRFVTPNLYRSGDRQIGTQSW